MKITRGFQARCGFPANGKKKYIERLLRLGFSVHIVNEGDGWLSRVKKRQFVECWSPIITVSDRRESH